MTKSRRDTPARKRKAARVAPDAREAAPAKPKRKAAAKPKTKVKAETETKRARKPPAIAVTPLPEARPVQACAEAMAPPRAFSSTAMREALAQLELAAALARAEAPPIEAAQAEAAPFDAPDESEWRLESVVVRAEPEAVPEPVVEIVAAAPPPFDLYTPAPPPPIPRASVEEGREALRRARLAAQAHGAALQKQQAQVRARLLGGGAYGIGIGVAACVVLGAALLLQSGGDEPAPLPPSAQAATLTVASVAAPREAATDQAQTYFAALRLLDEGDSEAGVRLLRRAAEGGFALAQYRLSKHYERGEGAPQSLALALQWAERAAEAGNVLAMHDVGVFYARGELGAPDEAAAFRWFRQAAEYGIADSQYNLGVLYLQGRGIAVDPREALFWFLVAAHNDDANAIDRAVAVAATLTPQDVAQLRDRARAFQSRTPNADANAPQA